MSNWIQSAPAFSELYSISDLHMGGKPGFQIFKQGPLLAEFIRRLAVKPTDGGPLGLVINGDTVDFLAEQDPEYFNEQKAVEMFDRIVGDPAFKPVFDALQFFTAQPGRRLIVTLGNHDLELVLPDVRERFLSSIAADEASRGRTTLAFEGTGFLARVGASTVYCIHGNDVDDWNVTDYETLRRKALDKQRGTSSEPWTPNAGTKLVIDVMNEIKKKYPFVDLLKPENEGVIPALAVLEPSATKKLGEVVKILGRRLRDRLKMATGFLSAEEGAASSGGADDPTGEKAVDAMLRATFAKPAAAGAEKAGSAEALLAAARRTLDGGKRPIDSLPASNSTETLGVGGAFIDWIRGKPKEEVLREALEKLEKDVSFEHDRPDATYRQMSAAVSDQVTFVVTGHTHLRRALRRPTGQGFYYNSGTWVRLMQIAPTYLRSTEAFKPVYDAMNGRTIQVLDEFQGPAPLVRLLPTAVRIARKNGKVESALVEATAGGAEPFVELPGTRFTV